MKKLILIACLLMAATAGAIEFKDWILIDDITFKKVIAGNARFNSISTSEIWVSQGLEAQAQDLFEAAANGSDKITLTPFGNISANTVFGFGNTGLYKNGVKVLSW